MSGTVMSVNQMKKSRKQSTDDNSSMNYSES